MKKGQKISFYSNQQLLNGVIVDFIDKKILVELDDKSLLVIEETDITGGY